MIILALGSNLDSVFGNRFININLALSYLQKYGIKILKKSSFYETPSYPDKSKPKFLNIVISAETVLPPVDLMSVLIYIEEKLGRKRSHRGPFRLFLTRRHRAVLVRKRRWSTACS